MCRELQGVHTSGSLYFRNLLLVLAEKLNSDAAFSGASVSTAMFATPADEVHPATKVESSTTLTGIAFSNLTSGMKATIEANLKEQLELDVLLPDDADHFQWVCSWSKPQVGTNPSPST